MPSTPAPKLCLHVYALCKKRLKRMVRPQLKHFGTAITRWLLEDVTYLHE